MNRSRITRFAFGIVFICFLLSTFVSLWSLRHMARQNMQELSKALTARIYDTISGELSEPTTVSLTMAHDRFLVDLLKKETDFDSDMFEQLLADYLSEIKNSLEYEAQWRQLLW